MSEEFAPPVRFPRLLAKVNAFLLVAALLVLTFGGIVAHKQGWFVKQTMIRVITPDALGISKGMPVKLFGYTIGSVSEMQLVAGGVDVQLSIMSEHMTRIPKGSRARFARESGVIGASVIEIIPGKPINGELAAGRADRVRPQPRHLGDRRGVPPPGGARLRRAEAGALSGQPLRRGHGGNPRRAARRGRAAAGDAQGDAPADREHRSRRSADGRDTAVGAARERKHRARHAGARRQARHHARVDRRRGAASCARPRPKPRKRCAACARSSIAANRRCATRARCSAPPSASGR